MGRPKGRPHRGLESDTIEVSGAKRARDKTWETGKTRLPRELENRNNRVVEGAPLKCLERYKGPCVDRVQKILQKLGTGSISYLRVGGTLSGAELD